MSRARIDQRCQACGYDLSAPLEFVTAPRCPECGLPFLPGEHPAPNWPGPTAVALEASGIYLVLLLLGTLVCLLPNGGGIGLVLLIPAAVMGIVCPVQASAVYGSRFPTLGARWKSRRAILLLGLSANMTATLIAFVLIRRHW